MPSDVSPAPAVDLTGLAQIAGALIAIVTALTYLVRLGKLVQLLDTLCLDAPRQDHVDGDAVLGDLAGQCLGPAEHRRADAVRQCQIRNRLLDA